MGTQLPLPQRGTASHFSAHIRCGQMAVQIKMPLGMEVGLSPGDFGLDGDLTPPKREAGAGGRAPSPIFGPWLLWPNGWMDQDGTWHGGRPWSSPHCARWGHSSPPQNGTQPPILGPSLLWPNGYSKWSFTKFPARKGRWGFYVTIRYWDLIMITPTQIIQSFPLHV